MEKDCGSREEQTVMEFLEDGGDHSYKSYEMAEVTKLPHAPTSV